MIKILFLYIILLPYNDLRSTLFKTFKQKRYEFIIEIIVILKTIFI